MSLFRREGDKVPEVVHIVTIPDEDIDKTRYYECDGRKYDKQYGLRIDIV